MIFMIRKIAFTHLPKKFKISRKNFKDDDQIKKFQIKKLLEFFGKRVNAIFLK